MWNIIQHAKKYVQDNLPVALVTLVDTNGSTYRKPGAKMVVGYEGEYIGTISGGCLERDVAHYAQIAIKEKRNQIIQYELNDDLVFGLGLGCGGSISLLIESDADLWLSSIFSNVDTVVVKQIKSDDEDDQPQTLCVYEEGKIIWQNPKYPFEDDEILAYCVWALKDKCSLHGEFVQQGKKVRLFFDFIQPPQSLIIFGGGDDALPVASFAQQLDFEVTVIDYKPINLEDPRFSGCAKLLWKQGEQPIPQLTKHSAVIIMSHHLERDAKALETFCGQNVNYIGLLGPKKRLRKLEGFFESITIQEIEADDRVYTPVGLDIGSETPKEVAVSILSEIIVVRNKAGGISLREKKGSIHKLPPVK